MATSQEPMGIKTMPERKPFDANCVVRSKEIRYKHNGKPYLLLELGDASGRLWARIWDNVAAHDRAISTGDIVSIRAVVQTFNGRKELNLQQITMLPPDAGVTLEELLPSTTKSIREMRCTFDTHRAALRNPHLRQLLTAIFADQAFDDAYFRSPGGKLWHHNHLGGMLEHVVKLLNHANMIKQHYPDIDSDLLKTGIICHGLGKVKEYSMNGYIDFTSEGRLIGHMAIGYAMLTRAIADLPGFPPSLARQLQHLLLSHEQKSSSMAVSPMTLEAIVLQHLIMLDAQASAIVRIHTYDIPEGAQWSKYIPLLDRFIYRENGKVEKGK